MAAPKQNQFWKKRRKHGRDKFFDSPEELWEEACKYFDWCDKNPLMTIEYYGKDAIRCEVPKMRAYTWTGLEYFLGISDLKNYRTKEEYKDFFPIISRIEQVLYTQKFEGAAAGLLNPSIIARDLQLKDTTDVTSKGEKLSPGPQLDLSGVPMETLLELAKHIDHTETKE